MERMEKTTTNFTVGFKTDIGRVREMNQDSYAILRRSELLQQLDALLVVADGMGGGKGGEVASRITAETLPDVAHEELAEVLMGRKLDIPGLLRMGMERANSKVRNKGVERREMGGMGTTCVAAILNDGALTVANAGDSRAYLLRDGELRQITEDHSQVWQEVKAGKMTREEAQKSKFRNKITKCIGWNDGVNPDIFNFELREGDTLLLCSDGLTTEVGDAEIANILASSPTAQAVCDRLTEAALQKGGSDNITVVALRYGEFTPPKGVTLAPETIIPAETEDDPTDERVEWRKSARQSNMDREPAAFAAPLFAAPSFAPDDEDDEEDSEPENDYTEPAPRRRRSRKRGRSAAEEEEILARKGGFATAVILTLLGLLMAVSIALGIALKYRTVILPPERKVFVSPNGPTGGNNGLEIRTDKNLLYLDPVEIYHGPVRDDVLQITDFGQILVATPEGRLLSLTPPDQAKANNQQKPEDADFKVAKLPDPTLPPAPKPGRDAKPGYPICVAFDASMNRYENDSASHNIFKYDSSGTRKRSDIGMARVMAPTRMLVDARGDIFLIDGHKIKRIVSYESSEQINLDNQKLKEGGK